MTEDMIVVIICMISPPSMLMEVMITYILYFILDSFNFYFLHNFLEYFHNAIKCSSNYFFIPSACSYRSVIFNYEISRLRFAPLEIRGCLSCTYVKH